MTGGQFERSFAKKLFNAGYWALNIPKDARGAQPFDIIALRGNKALAVDCKVCSQPRFPLARVEENQWSAFKLIVERYPRVDAGIVCLFDGTMFYIPYAHLVSAREENHASISLDTFYSVLCQHVIFGE